MRKITTASIAITTLLVLGAYQNCGKTNFNSSSSDGSNSTSGTGDGSGTGNGGATAPQDPDCGNKIKDGNTCREFACTSTVELTATQLSSVPARSANGICYTYKLMNAIAVGPSSATGVKDSSILARSHDVAMTNAAPWMMGSVQGKFKLLGPRVVKLAGSGSDPKVPISVDNFIITGVFPTGTTPTIASQYQARGSADATALNNGADSGRVLLNSTPLKFTPFGGSGSASVAPVDLTAEAIPGISQNFDVRALDCGGSRQLSDIYLLFQ